MPTVSEVEAYIRQAAMRRGIDPDIAVRVAKAEGLAPGVWQSDIDNNGVREPSYGPYQLYMGGGLGNEFERLTGKSAADPSTVFQQVDFALNQATRGGWGPYHGARRVGIGNRDGLLGSHTAPMMPDWGPGTVEFTKNNPQPGGYGPGLRPAGVVIAYARGRVIGARLERSNQAEAEKQARDVADQVEDNVGALPPKDAREELKRWQRLLRSS